MNNPQSKTNCERSWTSWGAWYLAICRIFGNINIMQSSHAYTQASPVSYAPQGKGFFWLNMDYTPYGH